MSRVRSFFLTEAGECLAELRGQVESPRLDMAALHRAARRFRGSAEMARFGVLAERSRELETRLRPYASGATPTEGPQELRDLVSAVVESLERGLEEVREGKLVEDPRMEEGMPEQGGGAGPNDQEVVPIEMLEYGGGAALERALSLREPLEDAIVSADPAGPILDELFDLIRLGSK